METVAAVVALPAVVVVAAAADDVAPGHLQDQLNVAAVADHRSVSIPSAASVVEERLAAASFADGVAASAVVSSRRLEPT